MIKNSCNSIFCLFVLFAVTMWSGCGNVAGNYPQTKIKSDSWAGKIQAEYSEKHFSIFLGERIKAEKIRGNQNEIFEKMKNGMGESAFESMKKSNPRHPLSKLILDDKDHYFFKAWLTFNSPVSLLFEPGSLSVQIDKGDQTISTSDAGIIFIQRKKQQSLLTSFSAPVSISHDFDHRSLGKKNKIIIRTDTSGKIQNIKLNSDKFTIQK